MRARAAPSLPRAGDLRPRGLTCSGAAQVGQAEPRGMADGGDVRAAAPRGAGRARLQQPPPHAVLGRGHPDLREGRPAAFSPGASLPRPFLARCEWRRRRRCADAPAVGATCHLRTGRPRLPRRAEAARAQVDDGRAGTPTGDVRHHPPQRRLGVRAAPRPAPRPLARAAH